MSSLILTLIAMAVAAALLVLGVTAINPQGARSFRANMHAMGALGEVEGVYRRLRLRDRIAPDCATFESTMGTEGWPRLPFTNLSIAYGQKTGDNGGDFVCLTASGVDADTYRSMRAMARSYVEGQGGSSRLVLTPSACGSADPGTFTDIAASPDDWPQAVPEPFRATLWIARNPPGASGGGVGGSDCLTTPYLEDNGVDRGGISAPGGDGGDPTDGGGARTDVLAPTVIVSNSSGASVLDAGETLSVTLRFSEQVSLPDPLSLTLTAGQGGATIGTATSMNGGAEADAAEFSYVVEASDPVTADVVVASVSAGIVDEAGNALDFTPASVPGLAIDFDDGPPTVPVLAGGTVPEDLSLGETVGTLSSTDPEGAVVTFSLPDGVADNRAFRIEGTALVLARPLDFETQPLLYPQIRAEDPSGNGTTATRIVTVTDANDAPVFIGQLGDIAAQYGLAIAPVDAGPLFDDADSGDTATYATVGSWPAWLTLDTSTGQITGTPDTSMAVSDLRVSRTDSQGAAATTNTFALSITVGLQGTGSVGDPYLYEDGTAAASCATYLTSSDPIYPPTPATDGVYTVQLDATTRIDAWCDMTTDGGGWTFPARADLDEELGTLFSGDDVLIISRDGATYRRSLITQLSTHASQPIALTAASFGGSALQALRLVPAAAITTGSTNGVTINGVEASFVNCDANSASGIGIYQSRPSPVIGSAALNDANRLDRVIASQMVFDVPVILTSMPDAYFAGFHVAFGGCSDSVTDAFFTSATQAGADYAGFALGLR